MLLSCLTVKRRKASCRAAPFLPIAIVDVRAEVLAVLDRAVSSSSLEGVLKPAASIVEGAILVELLASARLVMDGHRLLHEFPNLVQRRRVLIWKVLVVYVLLSVVL